jgi:catechol 2,3-dioxygenase-like lactoylglutathione lyase family enzyme
MEILSIAGFAAITRDAEASRALYEDGLGLPFKAMDDYRYVDGFDGAKHFGIWPLAMAAQSCFGTDDWPADVPEPQATIEFELADVEAVAAAVEELKARDYTFVHAARTEPWGQTLARLLSPEHLLIGLSYAPWLHASADEEE